MEDNTITVEDILLLHSTDKAYLVLSPDGEEVWISKSQVSYIRFGDNVVHEATGKPAKQILEMELPEWLAEKNNLV